MAYDCRKKVNCYDPGVKGSLPNPYVALERIQIIYPSDDGNIQ